jgi:hypothetical protein
MDRLRLRDDADAATAAAAATQTPQATPRRTSLGLGGIQEDNSRILKTIHNLNGDEHDDDDDGLISRELSGDGSVHSSRSVSMNSSHSMSRSISASSNFMSETTGDDSDSSTAATTSAAAANREAIRRSSKSLRGGLDVVDEGMEWVHGNGMMSRGGGGGRSGAAASRRRGGGAAAASWCRCACVSNAFRACFAGTGNSVRTALHWKPLSAMIFVLTLVALFLTDLRLWLFTKTADDASEVIGVTIVIVFVIEFMLLTMFERQYALSISFLVDLIAIASLSVDLAPVQQLLTGEIGCKV